MRNATHIFPPSGSPHGCCGKCLACPTCEPEVAAALCTQDNSWLFAPSLPAITDPLSKGDEDAD